MSSASPSRLPAGLAPFGTHAASKTALCVGRLGLWPWTQIGDRARQRKGQENPIVIFLLDTDILSENTKDSPDPSVAAFTRGSGQNIVSALSCWRRLPKESRTIRRPALKEFLADVSHYPWLSLVRWKLWNGAASPVPPSSKALR